MNYSSGATRNRIDKASHSSSSSNTNVRPATPPPTPSFKTSYKFPEQRQQQQQREQYRYDHLKRNGMGDRQSLAQQQHDKTEEFSAAVSWPILLAIIPTLGAFIAGSAEVWSDLIMILLVLYYVYMWITVPWSYYEGARSRRILYHFQDINEEINYGTSNDRTRAANTAAMLSRKKIMVQEELRRHEMIGLLWVIASPGIAAYTLQYSRYFLSNYEKYMSSFNVKVFVIGASIKPLIHVMSLLRERTLFLQSELQVDETELDSLRKKMEVLGDELDVLREAVATKKDLGQVTQNITPSIQQLSKALKSFEKKETQFRSWSEDRFSEFNKKFHDVDQFISYSVEQEQRKSIFVTLMFLPLNIILWATKRAATLLPMPNVILNLTATTGSLMTPTIMGSKKKPLGHLTNTATTSGGSSATMRNITAANTHFRDVQDLNMKSERYYASADD